MIRLRLDGGRDVPPGMDHLRHHSTLIDGPARRCVLCCEVDAQYDTDGNPVRDPAIQHMKTKHTRSIQKQAKAQ